MNQWDDASSRPSWRGAADIANGRRGPILTRDVAEHVSSRLPSLDQIRRRLNSAESAFSRAALAATRTARCVLDSEFGPGRPNLQALGAPDSELSDSKDLANTGRFELRIESGSGALVLGGRRAPVEALECCDQVVVGDLAQVDIVMGQDDDRPAADEDDDLVACLHGGGREGLELGIVRLIAPDVRPIPIDIDRQAPSAHLEVQDHLRSLRPPLRPEMSSGEVAAMECRALHRPIRVDPAAFPWAALRAPGPCGLLNLRNRHNLAAESATATDAPRDDRRIALTHA